MIGEQDIHDLEVIKEEFIKETQGAYPVCLDNAIEAIRKQIAPEPQVKCEECDFRKFTETFIDGVVDVMNKNGIASVEQLSEILKGGAE